MMRALCVLVAAMFICSCASNFIELRDKESNSVTYRLTKVSLKIDQSDADRYPDELSLLFDKNVKTTPADTSYSIYASVRAEGSTDIRKRDTLRFMIDSEPLVLTCTSFMQEKTLAYQGTTYHGRGYKMYWESPIYNIKPESLRKISKARSVTFDLYGQNRHITGKILPAGIKNIADFCGKYVQ
jgi:hypothetical protein